ncbi:MAG: 2Fe-2S iron-sulfur cluster-binding protein [Clostridia bacterium]|nr:2Fe-2S iron-sulfur cluster-binding protein [Clostridia bacterium]
MIEKFSLSGYNTFMKKLIINGNTVTTEAIKLKDLLTEYGMPFPCGGKGICGRCKITCHDLSPSALDKRFLSEVQLADGARLACDKSVVEGISIVFEPKTMLKEAIKLDYCNIAIIIGYQNIEIGILNEGIVESVILQNTAAGAINLRSLVGKQCIELFEKYGVAKADTIAVATNAHFAEMLLNSPSDGRGELLDAPDYSLPAETLYVLPFVDKNIGGDFLCKALDKSLPRLVVDAGETFVAGLFTDGDIFCLSHEKVSYAAEELSALKASLELLLSYTKRPLISLYGKNSLRLHGLLDGYSLAEEDDTTLETVATACNENRTRTRLLKLRDRVSLLETVDNDDWQRLFLSANN